MNELLKSFKSKNFLWGLGAGVLSYMLFPVIKESLRPAAGLGAAATVTGADGNLHNNASDYNYDLLAQELKNQREFTINQLGEIAQQLSNLQKEINNIKG